jgi:hypothetical protein
VLLTGGRFATYRTSMVTCTVGRLQQMVLRCERLHQKKKEKEHDVERGGLLDGAFPHTHNGST